MNASQQSLYEQLMQFEIDEPGVELTFARRLARENGWTVSYAERVIREYKRFLYLAMQAGHVVTPSEQVDQAWHLHLTYTRSYWEKLCREVLARPLHHGPTKGGSEEQRKYRDLYRQTLASYRQCFGSEPPGDIWSDVDTRFGDDLHHRAVNTKQYWIIPKPRWPRLVRSSAPWSVVPLMGTAGLGLPLLLGSNPLNWTGREFLMLYAVVVLVAIVLAMIARRVLRPPPVVLEVEELPPLRYDELAYLMGWPGRVIDAAVASMVQAGTLEIDQQRNSFLGLPLGKTTKLKRGKTPSRDAPMVEHAIFGAVKVPVANVLGIRKLAASAVTEIKSDLIQRGLVYQWPMLTLAAIVPAIIMATPLLLAIPKIFIGMERDKPVGFLGTATLATVAIALYFLSRLHRRTPAGDAALQQYQAKHQEWSAKSSTDVNALRPDEMGMLIGLFGAGMLVSSPLSSLHGMISRHSGGGGCGGSGGSFDGGGCGGGCGGGGCGGCGGD